VCLHEAADLRTHTAGVKRNCERLCDTV
jgi:hypothetical protein